MLCHCGCNQETKYYRKKPNKFIIGHNRKRVPHTEETKKKISKNNKRLFGEDNPMYGRTGINNPFFGKKHSKETLLKMSGKNNPMFGRTGNKNPNWHGGITETNDSIRASAKYSDWRMFIFHRDNFTCQNCGAKNCWLEVHHIKRFSDILKNNNIKTYEESLLCDELWSFDNGITLCKPCHLKQ